MAVCFHVSVRPFFIKFKTMKPKNFKVITPGGYIYTETAGEAREYQNLYRYPYVRNKSNSENQ